MDLSVPAWKYLISHTLSPDEAIPLIEVALMSEDTLQICQGITPSNSKVGLPAPEAEMRAEREV